MLDWELKSTEWPNVIFLLSTKIGAGLMKRYGPSFDTATSPQLSTIAALFN